MPRSPTRNCWLLLGPLWFQVLSCTLTSDPFTPTEVDALRPLDAGLPSTSAAPAPGSAQATLAPPADAGTCASSSELASCTLVQLAPDECASADDCASLHCRDGSCIAASCEDGLVNQGESGADCAGPCARRCGEGQGCTATSDCSQGLFCSEGARTCAPLSCADGTRNGSEVAADCGGTCPPCPVGTACTAHQDCSTGVCLRGTCQPARCNDGVRNGTEAFADCGNAECGACPIGSACTRNADCGSGLCQNAACREAPCGNGQRDALESDTDCGGADASCARCALGRACLSTRDCVAGSCVAGVCADCSNGVQDGSETASDCGGVCGPCGTGSGCQLDVHCESGICVDQRCCGGQQVDCTRCARRLVTGMSCASSGEAAAPICDAFLQCLQDNSSTCPTRLAPGCTDAGGVCDVERFGGNASAAIVRADRILGTATCAF